MTAKLMFPKKFAGRFRRGRPRKLTVRERETLYELRADGAPINDIAHEFGICEKTVRRTIKELDTEGELRFRAKKDRNK